MDEAKALSDAISLASGIKIPGHIGHRQCLEVAMHGAHGTFHLAGQCGCIIASRSRDQLQDAKQPAKPLALASSSFGVSAWRAQRMSSRNCENSTLTTYSANRGSLRYCDQTNASQLHCEFT